MCQFTKLSKLNCAACCKELQYGFGKKSLDVCQDCFWFVYWNSQNDIFTDMANMMKYRQYALFNDDLSIVFTVRLFDYLTNYKYDHKRAQIKELKYVFDNTWG